MSNPIRDVEKINQRQIETAKRRNDREIKTLENAHQNYKADLNKAQDLEIVDIQNAHHAQLNKEGEKKEKILEEMQSQLHQTKELTEKELKHLKDSSDKEKIEVSRKLSYDRERIIGENQLYLEELNERFNENSKKIGYDGRKRIDQTKDSMNEQYFDVEKLGKDKINKKTEEFTTRFKHDDLNYKKMKDQQDNQFQKERLSTNYRQQTELKKMTESHTGHIDKRDGEYRRGLKEQDIFFEKKYAVQLDTNNKVFKELEEKNKKVVHDLKNSLTKEITKVAERNNDPFFQFETLKPTVKQFEDRVEVEVQVPDHSKQDLQLTINGKEAIVSFNRRYTDAAKTHDGTVNKVSKVETYSTRLQTSHFLDAKSIKSSYENGVMSYIIKKA